MRPFFILAALFAASPAFAAPCSPDALGVSRVMSVGTQGGGGVGLKSYPRALALGDKEVALTFDDGPLPGPTEKVLDALKAECVRATFFLIGRNAAAHPALVKREAAEGHTIAHHTFSHPAVTLRGLSVEDAKADIDKGFAADDAAAGLSGAAPHVKFFRYPGFADVKAVNDALAARDVLIFGADLWASDWSPMTPEKQLALTMARLEKAGRGIVLFHDTRGQTAAMLPAFLRALKAKGFKVVHLVPGAGAPETTAAKPGWTSETDRLIAGLAKAQMAKTQPAKTQPAKPEAAKPQAAKAQATPKADGQEGPKPVQRQ